MIGDFEEKKAQAHQLAQRLLADEPPLRGLRQLGIFEEVIIRELQRAFHLLHLYDRLIASGIKECVFDEPSNLTSDLSSLIGFLGSNLKLSTIGERKFPNRSRAGRVLRRLRATGFEPSAIRAEMHELVRQIDPFHRRQLLRVRKRSWRRNDVWFYTTAETFTNIGLLYEPYFPELFSFLVENPRLGSKALARIGRSFVSVYDFAANGLIPSRAEIRMARAHVEGHLTTVRLSDKEKILRDVFVRGAFFKTFMRRLLPYGLFVTSVLERWLDTVQPAALVTGNSVFEGPALQLARKRGVPTVVLQHGILGDFCQFIDPPTDSYVVRGVFWREFLAAPVRPRALILNPAGPQSPTFQRSERRRSIAFFTAPYAMQEFWCETDLNDILQVLIKTAASLEAELIIRVHPLERVAEYRTRLDKLCGAEIERPILTFSQGSELESLLSRAAVAVMFSSTVFLDCIKIGVPIVSFDWHHFSYKN